MFNSFLWIVISLRMLQINNCKMTYWIGPALSFQSLSIKNSSESKLWSSCCGIIFWFFGAPNSWFYSTLMNAQVSLAKILMKKEMGFFAHVVFFCI